MKCELQPLSRLCGRSARYPFAASSLRGYFFLLHALLESQGQRAFGAHGLAMKIAPSDKASKEMTHDAHALGITRSARRPSRARSVGNYRRHGSARDVDLRKRIHVKHSKLKVIHYEQRKNHRDHPGRSSTYYFEGTQLPAIQDALASLEVAAPQKGRTHRDA